MSNVLIARKSDHLLDRIASLNDDADNGFELRSIEKEANTLLKTDAASAYMVLGIVYGIKGDYEQCTDNFSRSIKLYDYSVVRTNYAVSLQRIGRLSESYKQIEKALDISGFDIEIYQIAIPILFLSGHPEKVIELSEALVKSKSEINEQTQIIVNDSNKVLSYKLPDNYIASALSIADNVLFDSNAMAGGITFITDDSEQSLTYWIQTNLTPEETVELNMKLCNELAGSELDLLTFDSFTIIFRAAA